MDADIIQRIQKLKNRGVKIKDIALTFGCTQEEVLNALKPAPLVFEKPSPVVEVVVEKVKEKEVEKIPSKWDETNFNDFKIDDLEVVGED